MDKPSDASAFIAVILAFLGIADLTAASLTDLVALEYWLSNVPVRLTFLFALTAYSYLFKEGGMLNFGSTGKASAGENLQNGMVFSWAFFELVAWFWVRLESHLNFQQLTVPQIFSNLREERQNMARRILEQRKAEERSL